MKNIKFFGENNHLMCYIDIKKVLSFQNTLINYHETKYKMTSNTVKI